VTRLDARLLLALQTLCKLGLGDRVVQADKFTIKISMSCAKESVRCDLGSKLSGCQVEHFAESHLR
jgi:hypothetical protein